MNKITAWVKKAVGYKKVGGLNFLKIGRVGFMFYVAQDPAKKAAKKAVKLVDTCTNRTYN